MKVAGIGIVFAGGRGVGNFENALRQGWKPPSLVELPSDPDRPFPLYCVAKEIISDRTLLQKMRRADRFSKMAVVAAWDAIDDSGSALDDYKYSLGIIVATGFGPHVTTFHFLDELLNYGDANVSPTIFSNSVHNAAASYISLLLDSHGPTLTLTQFAFSLHQAFMLAQAWLQEKRCEYVLVGSVDECGAVMNYICNRKLQIADDGRVKPFCFSPSPVAVPGEGSVFFLVTHREPPKKYCEISVRVGTGNGIDKDKPDMYILDADGMTGDEGPYRESVDSTIPVAGYSPLVGSMVTGSGFNCAAGALTLMHQRQYASPVQDNPYSVNVCTVTKKVEMENIQCIRYNCAREKAIITARR